MALQVAFLIIVGVVLPVLAIQSDRYLRKGGAFPPRRQVWRQVLLMQWGLAGIALLTAWRSGIDLFPPPNLSPGVLGLAGAMLAAALVLMVAGHRLGPRKQFDRLIKLGPRGREDMAWWAAVSATAGISEEIVYRGVLYQLLLRMVGEAWLAALISAAAFALTHLVQGALGAAVIFIFALAFHVLVIRAGDLYAAMAVHGVYDLLAGVFVAWVAGKASTERR